MALVSLLMFFSFAFLYEQKISTSGQIPNVSQNQCKLNRKIWFALFWIKIKGEDINPTLQKYIGLVIKTTLKINAVSLWLFIE